MKIVFAVIVLIYGFSVGCKSDVDKKIPLPMVVETTAVIPESKPLAPQNTTSEVIDGYWMCITEPYIGHIAKWTHQDEFVWVERGDDQITNKQHKWEIKSIDPISFQSDRGDLVKLNGLLATNSTYDNLKLQYKKLAKGSEEEYIKIATVYFQMKKEIGRIKASHASEIKSLNAQLKKYKSSVKSKSKTLYGGSASVGCNGKVANVTVNCKYPNKAKAKAALSKKLSCITGFTSAIEYVIDECN